MKYIVAFMLIGILAGTGLASGETAPEEDQCCCACTCDETVDDCIGDCCTCEGEDCSETGTCDEACENCTCTEEEAEKPEPVTSPCGGCPGGGCH